MNWFWGRDASQRQVGQALLSLGGIVLGPVVSHDAGVTAQSAGGLPLYHIVAEHAETVFAEAEASSERGGYPQYVKDESLDRFTATFCRGLSGVHGDRARKRLRVGNDDRDLVGGECGELNSP